MSSTSQSQTHLDGRVVVHRLPVVAAGPGSDVQEPKRLLLPAGELAQLVDGRMAFHFLACLELRVGTVRGNHVHRQKHEWFYLMSGAVTLFALDPIQSNSLELPLEAGDLVFIAPGVAHGLRVVRAGVAVEFAPEPYDPSDTARHPVVPTESGV